MAETIKPSIIIQEFDKSQFITEGPSTITGVAGESRKGPSNELVFVSSYKQYEETFGKDSGYLDFFARFFFKYGGNKLFVVRATDNYEFAGLGVCTYGKYEVDGDIVIGDTDIPLTALSPQEGVLLADWPDSGIVRIDYLGSVEYVQYTAITGGNTLGTCKRGINGTTAMQIPVWGTTVTPSATTDLFTSSSVHGLRVGDIVRFDNTCGGVSIATDYYVVYRTSLTFKIATTFGGTAIALTDPASAGATNTVKEQPIPSAYVTLVAACVRGTVDTVGVPGARNIVYTNLEYGVIPSTGTIMYTAGAVVVESTYTTATGTATLLLGGSTALPAPAAVFSLVIPNYYGGLGTYTFSKYREYDAWDEPSYDEHGVVVDAGSVDDPDEAPLFLNIYAKTCGAWGNTDIRFSLYTKDNWNATPRPYYFGKVETVPTSDDELLIVVEDGLTGKILESFLVSLLLTKFDYWNKTMYINDVINEKSNYIRIFINSDYINQSTVLPNSVERFYLSGGTDGDGNPVREYKIMGAYDLFANKNELNIDILSAGGNQSFAVQQNIDAICETRQDCFGVLNIPYGYSTDDAIAYKRLLTSSTYSGVFYNCWEYLDPFTGSKIMLPPAIQITPIIVKSDLTKDPWWAAAGYNRGLLKEVSKLEHKIDDGDFELLYLEGINPIVNDGSGPVVLGIKTLTTVSSAFSKIPIRRLMIKIEKDIKKSMQGFLFEPNTFDTRLRIQRTVEPYLDGIVARDGVEDYKVICDLTNNTNTTIAQGKIIVDVYIKPIFAAEFIIFNFTVTKDEISSIINQ